MKRISKLDTTTVIRKVEDLDILADKSMSEMLTSAQVLAAPIKVCDIISSDKIHLHVRGYAYYYGGYAEHTRQCIFRLQDRDGFCIKLSPINSPVNVDPGVLNKINLLCKSPSFEIEKSIFLGILGPGWCQDDKKFIPQDGRYRIAWTMIETKKMSAEIAGWLDNVEEIWAPTNADVKRSYKHDNVVKMHLGYNDQLYHPNVKAADIVSLRKKYVYGVFGSWNKRKGIREIVRAFCDAFTSEDAAALLFVGRYGTRPYDENVSFCNCGELRKKEELNKWTISWELNKILEEINKDNLPQISVLDVPLHDNVLPHILSRFDCLVGFSHGESTWLPGLQALAMGQPVIQLAASSNGCMEYLDSCGFLCENVEYKLADEEDYLGTSIYYKGQELATGDEEELKDNMLKVFWHGEKIDRVSVGLKRIKDWTWDQAVNKVEERLKSLHRKIY